MAQYLQLHGQAERSRRLARDSTDTNLRDRLLELADEYAARATAMEDKETRSETPARTSLALPDRLIAIGDGAAIKHGRQSHARAQSTDQPITLVVVG